MPISIEGWIEINNLKNIEDESEHGPDHEKSWVGLINLSCLFLNAHEFAEALFGISKAYFNGTTCIKGKRIKPIAEDRGLPAFCSPQVMQDIDIIESKFAGEPIGGYTYATWAEVKRVIKDMDYKKIDEIKWNLVFDLLYKIEKQHHCQAKYLRFVVWFSW